MEYLFRDRNSFPFPFLIENVDLRTVLVKPSTVHAHCDGTTTEHFVPSL